MQELLDAGIIDLGGTGDLLLEIEYISNGEFKEAVYHLPLSCNKQDIVTATICHLETHSVIAIQFNQHAAFNICLPDRCSKLIEIRLPEAVGGDNITDLFE